MLNFSTIGFDMQVMIAKKLDFWTNLQLQFSSKNGKIIGNTASQSTVLELTKLKCEDYIVRMFFDNPLSEKKCNCHVVILKYCRCKVMQMQWRYIREFKKIPIFSVALIEKGPQISLEHLDYIDSVIKEAKILVKKSTLVWSSQDKHENEVFLKLVKTFDVTVFDAKRCYFDGSEPFMYLPEFLQMESVYFPKGKMSEGVLLNLKAPIISSIMYYSEDVQQSTIYRFFKQWLSKERQIKLFEVYFNQNEWIEDNFQDMPISLICSNMNFPRGHSLKEIYVMDRGDKKLRIELYYHLKASEIEDYSEFEKEIDLMVSNGLTHRPNKKGAVMKKLLKKCHLTKDLKGSFFEKNNYVNK